MARYGVWAPIPMWVGATRKWASGHNNRKLTAVVIHRMEGSLEGSDSYLRREFADYSPYPRLNASTHFGVGLWYGTPQIRQWVDTANTAWGWSARPTDTPSTVARNTLSNLYVGSEDLNWQVISVEVEGFYWQAWDTRTRDKVKELLRWIYKTHGSLVVMAHTDCSTKPCPGMSTFQAALPNYYGRRLGSIFGTTVPNTSTGTTTGSSTKVGGLPVNFKSRYGWKATIKPGKPRRSGASIASSNYGNTDSNGEPLPIWGEVVGQDFGSGSRWFFGPQYISSRWRIVYIPLIDLSNRNF
jgi:hypothetical protein